MKSRKGPLACIAVGSLLVLGPLFGLAGTTVGMARAFEALETTGPASSGELASSISLSLWSTAAGLIMAPVGIVLLVLGIVLLVRAGQQDNRMDLTA